MAILCCFLETKHDLPELKIPARLGRQLKSKHETYRWKQIRCIRDFLARKLKTLMKRKKITIPFISRFASIIDQQDNVQCLRK